MNGKTYPREVIDGREYFSGMLFFNELGDEVGSIIYARINKDSMGGYSLFAICLSTSGNKTWALVDLSPTPAASARRSQVLEPTARPAFYASSTRSSL